MLFFAASDFTFITRHIHNWVSYPLWPSHLIHSGAIGNSPLFTSSIFYTFRPGGLICLVSYLFAFNTVHEDLMANTLGWFAIPSSSGSRFVRTLCYDSSILGGPAWLIASLSYANPFTMTRQWFLRGFVSSTTGQLIFGWNLHSLDFFKNVLTIIGPIFFHINFRVCLLSSIQTSARI